MLRRIFQAAPSRGAFSFAFLMLLATGAENVPPGFALENGGFEEGVRNWAWEQYKGLPEPGRLEKQGAFEGKNCYRLGLAGAEGLRFINTGTFPILPGAAYSFCVAIACDEAPENAVFVRILQYGTEKGEKIEPQGWVVLPGGKDGDLLRTGGSHDWKEWAFAIPPDRLKASTKRLGVYVYHREIGFGTARIDKVALAPVPGTIPADALERVRREATEAVGKKSTEAAALVEAPQLGNLLSGDTTFETGAGGWEGARRVDGGTHGTSSLLAPAALTNFRSPNWYHVVRKGTNYVLSFDARGERNLSLIIDLWNLEYQIMKRHRVEVGPAWKRHQVWLDPQTGKHSLMLGFIKDREAALQLDALQFEAGAESPYRCAEAFLADAEILVRDAGSVFLAGALPLDIGVRFYNEALAGADYTIRAVTRDANGKERLRRETRVSVPRGRSEAASVRMLDARENGWFNCTLEVEGAPGKIALRREIPAVIVSPLARTGEDPASFFGIQGSGVPPEALVRLGARWYRSFRAWRWLENRQGNVTLAPSQWLPWKSNGLCLMETLQLTLMPDWAKAQGGRVKNAGDAAAYAAAIMQKLGSNARHWEIENEPDLVVPSSAKLGTEAGAAYYAELVREVSAAIRKADPGASVMASGVSGGDFDSWEFSREVFRHASSSFDTWAFHPYAPTRNLGPTGLSVSPEDNRLREKMLDAEAKVKQWGGRQRLWIGELGWAFDVKEPISSPFAMRHAEMLARSYVLARSVPAVERLFWFAVKGVLEGGYEYGMWRDERTPLPAVAAYAACARMLDHARLAKAVYESDVRAYVFRGDDGSAVAALWKHRGTPTELELGLPALRVRLTDMVGADAPPTERAGKSVIPLTSSPVYLQSPGTSPESLAAAIEAGKIAMDPVTLTASLAESSALRVVVKNNLPRRLAGTLRLECPAGLSTPSNLLPLDFDASGAASFLYRLEGEARGKDAALKLSAETKEGVVLRLLPLAADACPRLTPGFGSDLSGWGGAHATVLADRLYIQPPDAVVIWKSPENLEVEARVCWDEACFHFAALVKDDVFFQDRKGRGLWAGDSIQLAFDGRNDAVENAAGYDDNDHEFGMALCPEGPTFVRYAGPRALSSSENVAGVRLAIKNEGRETLYQVSIPWEALSPLTPAAGKRFAFNFIVNDNDGHGRKYWMGPTPGIGESKQPSLFRKYVLK